MRHSGSVSLSAGAVLRAVGLLALLSGFALGLLLFRVEHTGSTFHWAFRWNLFLAWVPLLVALLGTALLPHKRLHALMLLPLCALWLAFFPNAPYLVTDLVHLRKDKLMPYWFDVAMIFSFVFSSLLVGLFSLYLMQQQWHRYLPRFLAYLSSLVCLLLAGVGIYLGRMLRWNSWDLLTHHRQLLAQGLQLWQQPQAVTFIALHTSLLIICYLVLVAFIGLRRGT
jgi:uncharacterized membrane protein